MKKGSPSLNKTIILFVLISLLFSALPFVLSLIMDKSSLLLSLFTIWYTLIPPVALFIIAWILYRNERNLLAATGRIWTAAGTWFAVQLVLSSLSGLHILIKLLAFPSVTAGGRGFAAGTIIFLAGGLALYYAGSRRQAAPAEGKMPLIPAVSMLAALFVIIPLFIYTGGSISATAEVDESKVPPEKEIFSWVEDVYNLGIRRTGSQADLNAIDYLGSKLREVGIADVREEPYTFDYWEAEAWKLTVREGAGQKAVTSFYVPYSAPTGTNGLNAEMVYVGEKDFKNTDIKGKIVLVDLPAVNISWDKMKVFSYMAYDPDKSTKGWEHPYPIGWMFKYEAAYERAKEHGAAGIVGILQGYPDIGEFTYYAPYDGIFRSLPSLYVMEKSGEKLKSALKKGKLTATILLRARIEKQGGRTATVYGVLPGRSESSILIHCHHDAPWRSGIEDSSGVGMVLSLAKYFARIPAEKRAHTLVFMFTGSHMVGSKSNYAFIEKHRHGIMKNVLYDICLEHVADDYNPPRAATGNPEPRGLFLTENPVMAGMLARLAVRHNTRRLLLFPTGTPLGVPTDAQPFHNEGYRVASLISGPSWLFDDDDTLERVAKSELVPLTKFYADLISNMGRRSDFALSFNLNYIAIALVALVLTAIAAVGYRGRRGVN